MKILNLFYLILFFIQANVWAVEKNIVKDKSILQQIADEINSMSVTERTENWNYFLKDFTDADKRVLSKYVPDPSEKIIPKIVANSDELIMNVEGKQIHLKMIGFGKFLFENEVFELSKGKVKDTILRLESRLALKKFSLIEFVIPSAHAQVPVEFVITVISAIVMVAGLVTSLPISVPVIAVAFLGTTLGVASSAIWLDQSAVIKESCYETQKSLIDAKKISEEKYNQARVQIEHVINFAKNHPSCKRDSREKMCKEALECMEALKDSLDSSSVNIATGDRSSVKDVPQRPKAPKSPASGATKQ